MCSGSDQAGGLSWSHLFEVWQAPQRVFSSRWPVDGEEGERFPTRVDRRVESAGRNEDGLTGRDRKGLAVVDHLLAVAREDVEDLVRVRMVVAGVAPARHEGDARNAHCCGVWGLLFG